NEHHEQRVEHRAAPDTGRNVLMLPMRALSAPRQRKPLESHDLVTSAGTSGPSHCFSIVLYNDQPRSNATIRCSSPRRGTAEPTAPALPSRWVQFGPLAEKTASDRWPQRLARATGPNQVVAGSPSS